MGLENNMMELDGDLRYISIHKVLAMWSGYEYCLDASDVILTFTRVALCLANRRS